MSRRWSAQAEFASLAPVARAPYAIGKKARSPSAPY
jgi:hypothetical protein